MKKMILLHTVVFCMAFVTGCSKTDEQLSDTPSRLIFKASQQEVVTKSGSDTNVEQVIFTGDDIQWFNASTKEIRFKNNISQKVIIEGVISRSIRFYIDEEYLFSSMIYVSDLNSQIYDSFVFYYSQIENRFYLKDGYPDVSVLQNSAEHQDKRNENMAKIKAEWDKFINQLKLEGKYQE